MSLSKRASCYTHDQDSAYFLGWHEYEKNPFHEVNDLQGVIQMGLAENQLCFDLFESWLAKNPDAAGLKRDGISIFRDIAMLQHYHGLPAFKQALAEFMSEIRGNNVSFDPSHIVFTAGRATSADETLLFCLAGPGEAFLVPTPYNPRFNRDLKWRTGIEIVPVRCTSSNGFQITEAALNQAYEEAENRNLRVKGVLVMNPSNPLGTTMTSTELNLLVNFVEAKGVHLISDETYAGTVFSTPSFQSITQILQNRNNVEFSEVYKRIHVVYCLSKDLGLPGLGVGAIYSKDEKIVATAMKMSRFGSVSSQTQYLLSAVLSDTKFTSKFISANQKRLKKRHEMMVSELHEAGVNCLQSNAGLFCWVDMRHLLRSDTFEAEMELWKEIIYDVKLNISPGSSCHCSEPGWFRVCFANMSEEILVLAMERFKSFVTETKGSNT